MPGMSQANRGPPPLRGGLTMWITRAEYEGLKERHKELVMQVETMRLRALSAEGHVATVERSALDAEKRYHELTAQITAKAFAVPEPVPVQQVIQPPPDAEQRAQRRINTEAVSRLAEHMVTAEGVDPALARQEAQRLFDQLDLADAGGISMLGPDGDLDGAFGAPLMTE
jgi:thioredoxin-like negative regulator of GroEL